VSGRQFPQRTSAVRVQREKIRILISSQTNHAGGDGRRWEATSADRPHRASR
jgi:hypothetical protein